AGGGPPPPPPPPPTPPPPPPPPPPGPLCRRVGFNPPPPPPPTIPHEHPDSTRPSLLRPPAHSDLRIPPVCCDKTAPGAFPARG
ncbi:hemagglutinin, partial [Pseudomonas aeruginosa]